MENRQPILHRRNHRHRPRRPDRDDRRWIPEILTPDSQLIQIHDQLVARGARWVTRHPRPLPCSSLPTPRPPRPSRISSPSSARYRRPKAGPGHAPRQNHPDRGARPSRPPQLAKPGASIFQFFNRLPQMD